MFQRDYLMRMVAQVAQAVLRALGLIAKRKTLYLVPPLRLGSAPEANAISIASSSHSSRSAGVASSASTNAFRRVEANDIASVSLAATNVLESSAM